MGTWWSQADDELTIQVRVTPNGRRSELLDGTGDRLRVRVAAPAVDGKADTEVTRFVAEVFGVRTSAVAIVAGHRAREKTIIIRGVHDLPEALR